MQYKFVKFLSALICILPSSMRRFLGRALGILCWFVVPPKRKKLAVDNIMRGLKVDKLTACRIAKQSVTRFGNMFFEVLYFPKLNSKNINNTVILQGEEHLKEALSYKKGVILATAHTGNWELLGGALAMYGYPLVGVAQKQNNEQMDKFINEYRSMTGMHITYKSGVFEMVRLMKKNMIIGLLMDQDAHEAGAFVDFLGREASTPKGAAVLARMNHAPIVPAMITEIDNGRHLIKIYPITWVNESDDKEKDVFDATQTLTDIIAEHVKRHPQEWFWLHNRWKTKRVQA